MDGIKTASGKKANPRATQVLREVGEMFKRQFGFTYKIFENTMGEANLGLAVWNDNDEPSYASTLDIDYDGDEEGYVISVGTGRHSYSGGGALPNANARTLFGEAVKVALRESDLLPRSLRASLIRLAQKKPELRAHLVPLLREAADKAKNPEGAKLLFEKYKKEHPGTRKTPKDFYDPKGKRLEEKEVRRPGFGDRRKTVVEKEEKVKTPKDRRRKEEKERKKKQKGQTEEKAKSKSDSWKAKASRAKAKAQEKVKGMSPEAVAKKAKPLVKKWGDTPEKALAAANKFLNEDHERNLPSTMGRSRHDAEDKLAKKLIDAGRAQVYISRHLKQQKQETKMKESALYDSLVRLAHGKPELRAHLVPLLRKTAWDWRRDGVRPVDSDLIGKPYRGKVLKEMGEHPDGGTIVIIPRDTSGAGQQDPYQKVVLDNGMVTHDFGSVPSIR